MGGHIAPNSRSMRINPDGSVSNSVVIDSVNPSLPANLSSLSLFDEVTSVAMSVRTSILLLTVPANEERTIQKIEVSGNNMATYEVEINATVEGFRRTSLTVFNADFHFSEFKLLPTETIEVFVTHERPMVGDFEARIIGFSKP